jgi:hypothetical protein
MRRAPRTNTKAKPMTGAPIGQGLAQCGIGNLRKGAVLFLADIDVAEVSKHVGGTRE